MIESSGFGPDLNPVFHKVLENSSDVMVVMDSGGFFKQVNQAIQDITGYTPDEVIGKRYTEFLSPESIPSSEEERLLIIEGRKKATDFENSFIHKKGHKVYVSWSAYWSQEDQSIYGIGRDITDRVMMGGKLRLSEKKYRSLFEQASDAIMITDFAGNFLEVNSSLCQMFGYTNEELMQMNIAELLEPEELGQRPIRFDRLREGEHMFNKRNMLHRNGGIIPVEANVKKLDDDSIVAIARDVSSLRAAENRIRGDEALFRGIFENSPIGISLMSLDKKWIMVNDALCDILGYSREELLRLSFADVSHPDDIPDNFKGLQDLMSGEISVYRTRKRYIRKDRSVIWVSLNTLLQKDHNNKGLYFISQAENITLHRESEERYRALVDNATEALVVLDVYGGRFISVSKSAESLYGMSREELLQIGPMQVSPEYQPDGRLSAELAMEKIEMAIQGEKPFFEWTHQHKDGRLIPCEIRLVRLPSENSILIRGSVIDISERKKNEAEKELMRYMLNERVKELTTLYKAGQILQDESLGIHQALERITDLMPEGWQYDSIAAARIQYGNACFSTSGYMDTPWKQESAFNTVDGTGGLISITYLEERPAEAEGPFLAEERKLINMLAEMIRVYINRRHDAEALQKSEANFKTIFDTTETIYVMTDKDLQIISYNHAALKFAREELHIDDPSDMQLSTYVRNDREELIHSMISAALQGKPERFEADYRQPDGRVNWYDVRLEPVNNEHQELIGLLLSLDNITHRKRQQEYVDGQIGLLKELSYITSHELRHEYVKLHGVVNLIMDIEHTDEDIKDIVNNSREIFDRLDESIRKLNDKINLSF